ncbi:ADP-ribosylglycohydrolase family protein [Sphingomonas sp. ASV193]|uniref:ADP-ribosylglycohydrolase family protein n=1 Tax=Sphingomonas sp. ASV193 TaxID=3144405 RepID=UPI0032E916E4
MHDAPRCEGRTRKDEPCGAPAVAGKTRCRMHGGKVFAASAEAEAKLQGIYALLHMGALLTEQIHMLDKVIRKAEREGFDPLIIAALFERRNALFALTKLSQPELVKDFKPARAFGNEAINPQVLPERRRSRTKAERAAQIDRARGMLLGLAVGEAVGVTRSGQARGTFAAITDLVGGGPFNLRPGQWAGDTAMALALGDGLASREPFDEAAFLERLVGWSEQGACGWSEQGAFGWIGACFALDAAVNRALTYFAEAGKPQTEVSQSGGNASLARTASAALRCWNDPLARNEIAVRQCTVTHANPIVVSACLAMADIVAEAIAGEPRAKVLGKRTVSSTMSDRGMTVSQWHHCSVDEVSGEDDAAGSLEAALWAVGTSGTFEQAVLKAANLGGDAGSTAAIAGAIAGALYGKSSIPSRWLERLASSDRIEPLADALFELGRSERADG